MPAPAHRDVGLIPRTVFFGNPDRSSVAISPDGTRLSWLAPLDGVMNVWVAPRDDPAAARAVTADTGRGIRGYTWAFDNAHVLYIQDRNGDENWHVHAVDLATNATRDLTPFAGAQARIDGLSHRSPTEVVIGLNNRDPQWHDLHRVDVATGAMTLLLHNDRFASLTVDHQFRVAIAGETTADGGSRRYRPDGDGGWAVWDEVPAADLLTTAPAGFDGAGRILFAHDSRGRDTSALLAVDLHTGQSRVLAADDRVDASEVMFHPRDHGVQAVSFVYDRTRWVFLDAAVEADFAHLRTVADGEVTVASRSLDDRVWIVAHRRDDGPTAFHLFDRDSRTARFLFTNRRSLERLPLAPMRSVVIKARDGLDLVGYYTLPVGSDGDGDGIPDRPLPMVFTPHGGPWHRDVWGYNSWHQWLANRGYAVLSVNFRASTGFGKAFLNAGNRQWGGAILDDQVDAVRWAIDAGVADAGRVAVMGGSFGGFSCLAGLTFTPELFACGVDLVGVANLVTWITSIPAYWKPMLDMLADRVGDPNTAEGLAMLRRHSPLTHVDRICRPLLIAQGANDPRVRQAESDQIADSMRARGIPVTYVLYPDEGHGFARPQNNLSFSAVAEAFLAKCLGGRCEPIGGDLDGSSLQVLAGADEVPGLSAAIARTAAPSPLDRHDREPAVGPRPPAHAVRD